MPERSLGNGSYGCALYPAIVFKNSTIVTEINKYSYVTKVASDAENEYDRAYNVMKTLLKNGGSDLLKIGIFPLEPLHCGISMGDLGKFADAYLSGKCNNIVKRDIRQKEIQLYNYKDFIEGGEDSYEEDHRYRNSYACGIQYPKFDADLTQVIKRKFAVKDFKDLGKTLLSYLQTMHSFNIFHLDIKSDNLCVIGDAPKFADWGLSFVGNRGDDYIEQMENIIDVNYDTLKFRRGNHWPYYDQLNRHYFPFFDSRLYDLMMPAVIAMASLQGPRRKKIALEKRAMQAKKQVDDYDSDDDYSLNEITLVANNAAEAARSEYDVYEAKAAIPMPIFKKIFVFIDSACLMSTLLKLFEVFDKTYYVQQHKLANAFLLNSVFDIDSA